MEKQKYVYFLSSTSYSSYTITLDYLVTYKSDKSDKLDLNKEAISKMIQRTCQALKLYNVYGILINPKFVKNV